MTCALIMAGGSGQRFWPLSTKEKPKQLLALFSEKTMIQETVSRISSLIPYDQIYIATNALQAKAVREQLPMLPEANVIVEPAFKDTAAAVGYGTTYIRHQKGDCELVVLASDHLIQDVAQFLDVLETGILEAKEQGSIVTLGLKPDRPETGYGYIKTSSNSKLNAPNPVEQFCEKPDLSTAEAYVADGSYLWNSGMFVFSCKTIFEEMAQYLPGHMSVLENMKEIIEKDLVGEDLAEATKDLFEGFERISIDFGIMEKSHRIKVIPCSIGWNDIGSFNAFDDVMDKNHNGSVICNAEAKEIDAGNNIVYLEGDEVALVGVNNLVVVKSEGKLLICAKDAVQDIKKIFS